MSEARFQWTEELGSELADYHFSYPIKRNSEEVQRLVTATVYKTLSGYEVSSREQNRFIADSTNIKDEECQVPIFSDIIL